MDKYTQEQWQWSEGVTSSDAYMCDRLPEYNGWKAHYDYPGYIHYQHPTEDLFLSVSSDWNTPEHLDVQVQSSEGWYDDGNGITSGGGNVPWPYVGRTAEKMFALLKPFLDEYQNFRVVEGEV